MELKETIGRVLKAVAEQQSVMLPDVIEQDMALLDSGLDSLAFAILVAELESELGYDPFSLMSTPVYPATYGEFCAMYEKYASHRT